VPAGRLESLNLLTLEPYYPLFGVS
jgi:hypothetical protein